MASWLRRRADRSDPEPTPPAHEFTTPRERAIEGWRVLEEQASRRQGSGFVVLEGPGRRAGPAAVWPLSQVLTAAIDLALLDPTRLEGDGLSVAALRSTLARYRVGDGYGPFAGSRPRYYDDNAWIGLALVQLFGQTGDESALTHASEVLAFVRQGEDPRGGLRWVEGQTSRNTCTTGPAAELALRLAVGDPDAPVEELVGFAHAQLDWLDQTLRRDDGLYADHLDDRGVDHSVYSYNQGTPMGAQVLLHRITGDQGPLERARATADASLRAFDDDRLWTHQPAFNAIWLRNLLALHATEPDERIPATLARYLDRVWQAGRDPRTGWFTSGGIGSYDGRPTIDQVALVQLFALQGWPTERWADVS